MAYNGDSNLVKRQRTEVETNQLRQDSHNEQFNNYQSDNQNNHSEQQFNNFQSDDLRRKRPENLNPNHVLLFTIINPVYPITVDVLHTICSPIGQVLRIVIFKKNGVQAMVEFDNVETAKRAKESLNGADIYSGCCTLKIEYAKPTKLNVHKNDLESWDYTAPPTAVKNTEGRPAPLLPEPPRFAPAYTGDGMRGGGPGYMEPYDESGYQNGPGGGGYDHFGERYPPGPMDGRYMMKPPGPPGREPLHSGPPPRGFGILHSPPNGTQSGGSVMMVYGLSPDKSNTDKLFNLFCLYGNVVKIKFLKTKDGCAMVQMGDTISVERCISNLNNVSLGNDVKIQLGFSKQAYLSDVAQPYTLPDNSLSFKDFMGNKNNRFINPTMASKNRIQGPSKVLHFFNAPPNVTEDQLNEIFEEKNIPKPNAQLFPMKGDRSSTGLLEFDSVETALNALMECNHTPIKNPAGKFPYVLKLCFSSNRFPVPINSGHKSSYTSEDQPME